MLTKVFRFAIGCAIGFLVWRYGTPIYAAAVAPLARVFLSASRLFAGTRLTPAGMNIEISGPSIPPVRIPFSELTYNVILFFGLFATVRGLFRDRSVIRFALAAVVLALTHVFATVADAVFVYATRLGTWSNAHFSPFEQDFWTAADYVYRIGGMFAIAFACWVVAAGPAALRSASAGRPSRARG